MAGFALVLAPHGSLSVPGAPARAAAFRALGERCRGEIVERTEGRLWCCQSGHDGRLVAGQGSLFVIDGRPVLADAPSAPATFRPQAIDPAMWRQKREGLLPSLDGGFALASYDASRDELTLARDRFGEKPLFYALQAGHLYVASECKLLAALGVRLRVSRTALDEALVCRWLLRDRSLFEPVMQVPAGHWLSVSGGDSPQVRRYWQLGFAPEAGGALDLLRYRDEARTALGSAIQQAAQGRREIGVLLSGGVDSSVIAGAARETVGRVIGFAARLPGSENLELDRSLQVARHLGIECRVVDISIADFEAQVRAMVRRLEEPPRQPNNLVLQQLFKRAAEETDLVLQGDAAEMLFGLADVHRVGRFRRKHEMLRYMPRPLRAAIAAGLRLLNNGLAIRAANALSCDPQFYAAMLDSVDYGPAVQRTLQATVQAGAASFLPMHYFDDYPEFDDALQAYQLYTFAAVSLVRHDRLAQPLGLNSESPFLRAPVVDLARRLPRALRFVEQSKPVLRALCDLYLPPEVSRWSKLGFPVPWQQWMRQAIPGGIGRDPKIDRLLPGGFVDAALASGDAEAQWTVWTLRMAVEELGAET